MSGVALWVPGPWTDQSEFVKAIASADDGVVAAGGMIVDGASKQNAMFQLLPREKDIAREMFVGSGRSLDRETLDAIDDHKSVAAVTVVDTGEGLEQRLGVFTRAVRAAGGIAAKVHYSGLAHGWDRWEGQLRSEMPAGLFRLLVVQVPDPAAGYVSSFGMKQFALADGAVEGEGGDVDTAWALFEFNIYLWREQPQLRDGHTFSRAGAGAQIYRLAHTADRRYPEDHPYLNPHGIWHLSVV
jgi:hypothetical protein